MGARPDPYRQFNFRLEIDGLSTSVFSEYKVNQKPRYSQIVDAGHLNGEFLFIPRVWVARAFSRLSRAATRQRRTRRPGGWRG